MSAYISTEWVWKDPRRAKQESVFATPVQRWNQKERNPFIIVVSAKLSPTAERLPDEGLEEGAQKLVFQCLRKFLIGYWHLELESRYHKNRTKVQARFRHLPMTDSRIITWPKKDFC
jgi:hypothetical protein